MNQTKLDELIEKREKEKKDWYRDSYIQDEMLDDLRSLKDQEQEERLLWEDLPYNDDLGCRIYWYVKDWVVNITRVEYTKHIIPQKSEQEVEIKKENFIIVGCPRCDWWLDAIEDCDYCYCPWCWAKINRVD